MESETKVSCHDFGPSKTVQNVKQTEQDNLRSFEQGLESKL